MEILIGPQPYYDWLHWPGKGVPSTVFKLFSVLCKFGDDTLKIQAGILKILCGPQSIYYFQAGPRDEYTKQLVHLVSSFLKVQ